MPVKTFRPLTPSTRYITFADFSEITKTRPEKSLVEIRKRSGGRNHYGRATARGIGGGHKQKIHLVDFKRQKHGVEATVSAIEYDPGRTARLALLEYKDGEKAYILAPEGLKANDQTWPTWPRSARRFLKVAVSHSTISPGSMMRVFGGPTPTARILPSGANARQ